jgi:DNA-directed RNA polymerase specialized sigma24 family protein
MDQEGSSGRSKNRVHTDPCDPSLIVDSATADVRVLQALAAVYPSVVKYAHLRLQDKSCLFEIVSSAVHSMTAVLRKGTVIENPEAYLKRSIRNGINQAASIEDKTESTEPETFDQEPDNSTIDWENTLVRQILLKELIERIDNETTKQVIYLRLKDHGSRYIAKVLGISEESARKHYSLGLNFIRGYLNPVRNKKAGV